MCDASLAKFDLRAMGRGFLQINLYVAQQPYVCMTMCTYSPAVRGPGGHCDSGSWRSFPLTASRAVVNPLILPVVHCACECSFMQSVFWISDHRVLAGTSQVWVARDRETCETCEERDPRSWRVRLWFTRTMSQVRKRSALDRPLPMRGKNEVGLSAFSFLFSEFIQYSQQRVDTADQLERKLEDAGVGIGRRVLELGCLREKSSKRETRMLGILNFITSVVWKMLFGNAADSLEKSVDQEDEFMIVEKAPLVNMYISSAPCSCATFVAGIVRGVLEGAQVRSPVINAPLLLPFARPLTSHGAAFSTQFPARVSAHEQEDENGPVRTVILIKFAPEVLEREKRLAS